MGKKKQGNGKGGGGNSHDRSVARAASGIQPSSPKPDTLMQVSQSPKSLLPIKPWDRFFAFIENGIVLTVAGIVASFAGVVIAGKYFVFLSIPLVLGLHRSKGLVGLSARKKVAAYCAVFAISLPLWLLGVQVDKSRTHIPTVQEIAQAVAKIIGGKPSPSGVAKTVDTPISPTGPNLSSSPKEATVQKSIEKKSDSHKNTDALQQSFQALKRAISKDADDPEKIKADFGNYRKKAEKLWPNDPATRSGLASQLEGIENEFIKNAGNKSQIDEMVSALQFGRPQDQSRIVIPDNCKTIGIVGGRGENDFDNVTTNNADCGIIAPGSKNSFKNVHTNYAAPQKN
jgi:hypothetical protein